ncbi:MAG: hypothetical protein GY909_15420 [Oligoflexia bacterium]|nr:hypothetical protein [Oligoflexia bacterium]
MRVSLTIDNVNNIDALKLKFIEIEDDDFPNTNTFQYVKKYLRKNSIRYDKVLKQFQIFRFKDIKFIKGLLENIVKDELKIATNEEFDNYLDEFSRKQNVEEVLNGNYEPLNLGISPQREKICAFIKASEYRAIIFSNVASDTIFDVIRLLKKEGKGFDIISSPSALESIKTKYYKEFSNDLNIYKYSQIYEHFSEVLIIHQASNIFNRNTYKFKDIKKISKNYKKIIILSNKYPKESPKGLFSLVNILYPQVSIEWYKKTYLEKEYVGERYVYKKFKNSSYKEHMKHFIYEDRFSLNDKSSLSVKVDNKANASELFIKSLTLIKELSKEYKILVYVPFSASDCAKVAKKFDLPHNAWPYDSLCDRTLILCSYKDFPKSTNFEMVINFEGNFSPKYKIEGIKEVIIKPL